MTLDVGHRSRAAVDAVSISPNRQAMADNNLPNIVSECNGRKQKGHSELEGVVHR